MRMKKMDAIKSEFRELGGELSALPYPPEAQKIDGIQPTIEGDIRNLIERFENLVALSLKTGFWGGKKYSYVEIANILKMEYRHRLHKPKIKKQIRVAAYACLHLIGELEENDNLYTFIEDAGFSKRTLKKLKWYLLIEQITRVTKESLLTQIGVKALREVEAKLVEYGLALAERQTVEDQD